ncbi:hypothetical protein Tcan_17989 [Toxocara canis]|uniref:N-acetyltransferase domain-containing protein n=1 Tax=Toxocara canis TaxID=6265 RepID=A0A0B2W5V2_TOXCA|nr:hypothetical protein Tcan_17989 [Toxocara canis]
MIDTPKLEPFKEVLRRQVPSELGKPISMKVYDIKQPKDCGNPWNGAYSKHGFWYKFYEGNSSDFEKVVALSYETDGYCMNYESFEAWKAAFGEKFVLIVAKNLREDILGSIAFACYNNIAIIGIYYVIEDYRHSGIGSKLFADVIKKLDHKDILFHSSSHLSDRCSRYGLRPTGWTFTHYIVDKPSGLQSLQDTGITIKRMDDLTTTQESDLFAYDRGVCNMDRSQWGRVWLRHFDSDTIVAFDHSVVALSYETDGYCMNYESFEAWKAAFGEKFVLIVAKNLREDILGSIAFACYNNIAIIGIYYVIEDYRHSGIGSKLFAEVIKKLDHKDVLFHSSSHLSDRCSRYGLRPTGWTFTHYIVDKPSGLQSLQDTGITIKRMDDLTTTQESDLFAYDRGVCNMDRSQWGRVWLRHFDSDTIVAFDHSGTITGFGNVRELGGGFVKRILVGPLYADNEKVASAILFALLVKFYNPENDHEWDPDVFAIYRRSVHLIIPEGKNEMLEVMRKLKGDTGTTTKQRLCYKTQCSGSVPEVSFTKIFALSDMHLSIV